jgi:hypothetical protein
VSKVAWADPPDGAAEFARVFRSMMAKRSAGKPDAVAG